jgi:plastocyanin
MYRIWVFLHVVGVAGFLASHGVSMFVTLRIPREREPRRIADLIELSSSSTGWMWNSMGLLLVGGVVSAFLGHWWGEAWLLVSIAILLATIVAMYALAKPWFHRVGFVARSLADGSTAVSQEEFEGLLDSRRPHVVAAIGFLGILAILFLMLAQPDFGGGPSEAAASGPTIVADDATTFATSTLTVPAGEPFPLLFRNDDPGVPHDVEIKDEDGRVRFEGDPVTGPASVTYQVPALQPGTYPFLCTIHPQMTGTITAAPGAASATPSGG